MLVFLRCFPAKEEVKVIVRLQCATGPTRRKVSVGVAPGMLWRGYSYQELMRLGTGTHKLQIPRPIDQGEPISDRRFG